MNTRTVLPDGLPTRWPPEQRDGSILASETKSMERKRRLAEQQGQRQLGCSVKARDHSNEALQDNNPGSELQENHTSDIQSHPELNSQRFDGVDPNISPVPVVNTAANEAYKQEKQKQQEELQLRLGNMPKMGTAPKPRGPV